MHIFCVHTYIYTNNYMFCTIITVCNPTLLSHGVNKKKVPVLNTKKESIEKKQITITQKNNIVITMGQNNGCAELNTGQQQQQLSDT